MQIWKNGTYKQRTLTEKIFYAYNLHAPIFAN